MISEIQFPEIEKSAAFRYAKDLPFFKKEKSLLLKPGLNILFGANGSGKTTVLRMAALSLAAEQGGVSTVTNSWFDSIRGRSGDFPTTLEGVHVVHDGQPILYGNPRNQVGLFGGGAAFDYDFMGEGLSNLQSEDSTGYTTLRRIMRILKTVEGALPFPTKFDDRVFRDELSGPNPPVLSASHQAAYALLKGEIPPGDRTVILDEPESGLAITAQRNLFLKILEAALLNNFQIIIATHSAFSLGLPFTNYVEMTPDLIGHVESAIMLLAASLETQKQDAKSKSS